jgi:L-ascorbate metabolism protein UlaG (beta-lactamase superfamily)
MRKDTQTQTLGVLILLLLLILSKLQSATTRLTCCACAADYWKMRRRTFLKYAMAGSGAAAGGASWWLATSKRRAARWMRTMIADARRKITLAPVKPNPAAWSDNKITLCWLGHSTVLINFYGMRILTDPAFGSRVGISLGLGTAGPKRYIAPALSVKQLPALDLVLLSHAHMDHMDLPSLSAITTKQRKQDTAGTPVLQTVTAKLTQDVLSGTGLKQISELGWNDRTTIRNNKGELEIEAVEVRHWGQRWPSELERGYNGYILRREGKALLFGGDSALTPLFRQLHSQGPFEAAIMPIGAYRPWIWNHCDPEQAVQMANWAGARYIVPVHHSTFKLSDEPMNEPIERIQQAVHTEPERLALRQVGESFTVPV